MKKLAIIPALACVFCERRTCGDGCPFFVSSSLMSAFVSSGHNDANA